MPTPREPRLFRHLTVLDNLTVVSSESKEQAKARAMKLLAKVGLSESATLYPEELSGGMAQRVALARAMMTDCPILLLDEPFSALDQDTRSKMIFVVKEYVQNKTLIIVTHNLADAELLADRIIEL